MKPLGYSLEQMAELLGVVDRLRAGEQAAAAPLQEYIADALDRRSRLAGQLGMADEFVSLLEKEA